MWEKREEKNGSQWENMFKRCTVRKIVKIYASEENKGKLKVLKIYSSCGR
jgi:hypothetical protein